jgi:hypothetical protein
VPDLKDKLEQLRAAVLVSASDPAKRLQAAQLLGDAGADVIKVEPPAGDETRRWGPPWIHGSSGASASR